MKQFEERFEAALSALEHDGRAASVFVYTELTLHHFFGGDLEVMDRVNPHAGFWNGILAGLQTSGFIALGRLYDRDSNDHTLHALLEFVGEHRGLFQPVQLEQRRIRAGMAADDARTFASQAASLKASVVAELGKEFERHRALYDTNVRPIRHSVFAHAGRISRQERDALFTRVFTRELERMVVFPLRLHRALFQLYMNGDEPLLDSPPTLITDVLNALPDDSTTTWEHLHAAKNAVAMVLWMKNSPLSLERMDPEIVRRLIRAMQLDQIGLKEEDFANGDESAPNSTVDETSGENRGEIDASLPATEAVTPRRDESRHITSYVRLIGRLLAWNLVPLISLCLIAAAIGSDQGQELVRISSDAAAGSLGRPGMLALPVLLFASVVAVSGMIVGEAGTRYTRESASSGVTSTHDLLAARLIMPCLLGALAAVVITACIDPPAAAGMAIVIVAAGMSFVAWAAARSWSTFSTTRGPVLWVVSGVLLAAAGLWCMWLVQSPDAARATGPIGVLIVALATWSAVLSLLFVALPMRFRLPSLVGVIPLLWLGASFVHDPNVWPRRDSPRVTERQLVELGKPRSVLQALQPWLLQFEHDDANAPIPVYLVSAEGGGVRAAYWTARTLAQLNQLTVGEFSRHVFVYSGVSGGSLGITVFEDAARHAGANAPRATQQVEDFLGRDYLSPLLSRAVITEPLWQLLGPAAGVVPRDVAFERQWDSDWRQVSGSGLFTQPFLHAYGVRADRARPILILNATNVETGKRLLIANWSPAVARTDFLEPLVLDGVRETLADVTVAEAVHLSARFPYVSPPASLQMRIPGEAADQFAVKRWGRAVDGGYFDNSAGLAVRDIFGELLRLRSFARRGHGVSQAGVAWEQLRPLVARLRVHIIVIRNDPQASRSRERNDYPTLTRDVVRYPLPFDFEEVSKQHALGTAVSPVPALSEWFAPLQTMITTREARAAATRRALWESVSDSSDGLSYECEIERRVAAGTPVTFPLTYSPQCIQEGDTYSEISLADTALETREDGNAAQCDAERVTDISLGWALSKASQRTLACLANSSQALRDIATSLVPLRTADL